MLGFEMLGFETTTQWFEISSDLSQRAWQESQSIPIPGQRWQVYLNWVCLETVRPWLQEILGQEAIQEPILDAIANSDLQAGNGQMGLWQMLNGSVLTLDTRRFVLIPQEAMDRAEFRVSQEWLDIPSWAADYYLAVEVDADAQELQIWGYATHQMLKQLGSYDASDRAYCLAGDQVIQDMTTFEVMQHLPPEPTRAEIAPLPELSPSQAETLIQQLGNPAIVLPRLEVDFALWGSLLASPAGLQHLCEQQQRSIINPVINPAINPVINPVIEPEANPVRTSRELIPVNLGQWFQDLFEPGWQAIEEIFGDTPDLAFSLRQEEPKQLGIRRVKRIHLNATLPDVLLVMTLATEASDRRWIWVQLLPWQGESYLPAHLKLTLLSSNSTVMQSVEAGTQSNYIQLRRFKCPTNTEFKLQVAVENASVTEFFVS